MRNMSSAWCGSSDHIKELLMVHGTVLWFNVERGYGFIKPDDGSRDVFVHISVVGRAGLKGLKEGQKISFDEHLDSRGKTSAVNLKSL